MSHGSVTLVQQYRELTREGSLDVALDKIADMLDDPAIRARLKVLAVEGLLEGYTLFGDEACHWHDNEIAKNVLEELRDCVVYLVIGGIALHR